MPSKKRKLSEIVVVDEDDESSGVQEVQVDEELRQTDTNTRQDNPSKKLKPFDVKVFRKSLKGTDFIFGEYSSDPCVARDLFPLNHFPSLQK